MFECSQYIGKTVKSLEELNNICNNIVGPHPMSSWYCGAREKENDTVLIEVWKECNRFMCFELDDLRGYMVFKVKETNEGYVIIDCSYREED